MSQNTNTANNGSGGEAVTKRLKKELMSMMMSGDKGTSACPAGDNMFEWTATIVAPSGTVYEGLTYKLKMVFSADYPYTAPTVTFTTPCFHPNVDGAGNICLDILKEKWSAAYVTARPLLLALDYTIPAPLSFQQSHLPPPPRYNVKTILLSLQSLLGDPNNDSPLNVQAAGLWEDQVEYKLQLHAKFEAGTV